MSATIPDLWKNLAESRLLPMEECRRLKGAYAGLRGASQTGSAGTLAEWLISEGAITRFQAQVLLAGRSGPFFYGDYRVAERYKSGRLAGLFRADHVPTGHPVMLSFVAGAVAQNEALWRLAAGQAQAAAAVVHPQVSRLFELVDLVTYKFAVMETLPGEALEKILASGNPLPAPEACRIARLAALGLSRLHETARAHGELRPENIWMETRGNIKLLDIPLSHPFGTQAGRFQTDGSEPEERLRTKADYLAPEIAHTGASAGVLSDVYSLGCVLYQMLTGQVPFEGGSAAEKIQRHAAEAIRPLEQAGVPHPLAQVVTYMMAKNPALRYQQMGQLADALAGFVDPNQLNPSLEPPNHTLAAFEQQVRQRAATPRAAAERPAPFPDIQLATAGPVRGGAPRVGDGLPARGSPVAAPVASRKRRVSTNAVVGWSAAAAALIVAVVIFANQPGGSQTDASVDDGVARADGAPDDIADDAYAGPKIILPDVRPPKSRPPKAGSDHSEVERNGGREITIPDNGKTLWASPTSGPPLRLAYLPPGDVIYLALRPAELFISPEGEKIRTALGPIGDAYLDELQQITGFPLEDIEQVILGLQAGPAGGLSGSWVVRLREPTSQDVFLARWNKPAPAQHAGITYYTKGGWAYFVPAKEDNRVFAVTSPERIQEVIDARGAPPPMRREMENMLSDTDVDRHLTLLFPPNYLFTDGKKAVFSGGAARLEKPLYWFIGYDQIRSGILSFHVGDDFFSELRLSGTLDVSPDRLADEVTARLDEVPDEIQKFIVSLNPHPWTLDVLARFPRMIETLHEFTRTGTEHQQAVLRSYLPAAAAHNLMMGVELTLAQQPGAGGTVAAGSKPPSDGPKRVAERLGQTTSLSFPRDTLEMSLKLLSEAVGIEIVIIGGDLQLDGITKNQSFGIDLRDRPAREILTQILLLANPDKTAMGPSDPKQKLVYVIKPTEGGEEAIYVTTRSQAEKRGDKLPEQFLATEDGKKKG